jgi:hypothetical protein
MTTQVSEGLLIDGERLHMSTRPLAPWFDLAGIPSPFVATMSWNWRGYHGTWELVSDRLYLVALAGKVGARDDEYEDEDEREDGCIATLFPDFPDRVFAHWFTGTLQAEGGELIDIGRVNRPAIYARSVVIDIERGRVTGRTERAHAQVATDSAAAAAPPARTPRP